MACIYSSAEIFRKPFSPKTLPVLSNKTTNGKLPSTLQKMIVKKYKLKMNFKKLIQMFSKQEKKLNLIKPKQRNSRKIKLAMNLSPHILFCVGLAAYFPQDKYLILLPIITSLIHARHILGIPLQNKR